MRLNALVSVDHLRRELWLAMVKFMWKSGPAFLVALSLFASACGGSEETSDATSAQDKEVGATSESPSESGLDNSEEIDPITVDEGLFSTEVRLPLGMFSDDPSLSLTEEDLRAEFDADGYDIDISLDGDVAVLRMSNSTYEQVKLEMRQGVDEIIDETLQTESEIYKSVKYSDDMREFTVEVDPVAFGQSMSFFSFGVMLGASFYQPFAGVDPDDRYVKITYVDAASGEVIDVYDTREL